MSFGIGDRDREKGLEEASIDETLVNMVRAYTKGGNNCISLNGGKTRNVDPTKLGLYMTQVEPT